MSLSPQEIAYQQAHIDDDRRVDVVISMIICLTAAWTSVVLRLISRRIAKCRLEMDDYMILVGLVRAERSLLSLVLLINVDCVYLQFFTTVSAADTFLGTSYTNIILSHKASLMMVCFLLIGVRYGLGRHFILVKTPENFAKVRIRCDCAFLRG